MSAAAAMAHYRQQQRLARRTANQVQRLWSRIDSGDITGSWQAIAPRLIATVTAAQEAAAAEADAYVAAVIASQGATSDPSGRIDPRGFAGLASDGRSLWSLLYQPVISWKAGLAAGLAPPEAASRALGDALRIATTQVTDAGRTAVGASMAANRTIRGYIRIAAPPCCARCAILAGTEYGWNAGFQRHPRCDCVHMPATLAARGRRGRGPLQPPPGTITDAKAYFNSLSRAEQDRIFTRAGAQAIRDGADIASVVNARRGMYTAAAGSLRLPATREATTRRGLWFAREFRRLQDIGAIPRGASPRGYRLPGPRLMPEAIYQLASSRDDAIRLLRRYGYIT
ncbi:hypothetical protein [Streptomyces harbinensis]|uniref:hypothetical protein n=1 Tax=Streptomyces harbinensis TaxID=1176198 RepID=UPI0036A737C5